MEKLIYKTAPVGELMDTDDKRYVKGYGSVFGNIDSDGDMLMPGAYAKTIKENGYRVKYLYQHDMSKPIGKMSELYEDQKGLGFVAEVPETRLGKDVIELMKAGVITENSVGILPIQKGYNDNIREITEVKLYEISAVTMAANDQAKITNVKSQNNQEELFKRYDNLCKLIRKGDISDELGYAIEGEIQKLKSLFIASFTLPEETTEPKEEKSDDTEILNYLIHKLK